MSNRATLEIAARPSVRTSRLTPCSHSLTLCLEPVMHVRPMSTRHAPDMEIQALERLATACTSEKYRERVNTLGADERFDRALSRIEDLMLFFIRMCEADEHYMQRFDEDTAAPGSELARARAAASLLLRAVAWDAGHVSPFHPLRTQNELLGMQIDDFCEVVNKYLSRPCTFPWVFLECCADVGGAQRSTTRRKIGRASGMRCTCSSTPSGRLSRSSRRSKVPQHESSRLVATVTARPIPSFPSPCLFSLWKYTSISTLIGSIFFVYHLCDCVQDPTLLQ
jgi:hypothetical protein